jgi:hypothetical protein
MKNPARAKDMLGLRFERLVVISRAPSDKNGNAKWNCQCDCGNTTVTSGFTLRNGEAKSCGCLTTDQLKQRVTTHGQARTVEYRCWAGMIQRCDNPKSNKYHRYGGRGIRVCPQWYSFEVFYADMGPRPSSGHSIERRDRDGNYEPKNCYWATDYEQRINQSNNRYVDYNGNMVALKEAIRLSGTSLGWQTVRGRLDRGWSLDDSLHTPPGEERLSLRRRP